MRKGFTLMELLAVIVILAIIASIAVPIVLSVIENIKKSSLLSSAKIYVKGIENLIMQEDRKQDSNFLSSQCIITEEGDLYFEEKDLILEVKVSGEKPIDGEIIFESKKIKGAKLIYSDAIISINENGEYIYNKRIIDPNEKYISIDSYTHQTGEGTVELHNIKRGKCTKCGETSIIENKNYKFIVVETVEQLEKEIIDFSNNGIYIKPGVYTLTKGIVFQNENEMNIVGLGNSKEDVIIDAGNILVDPDTCNYVVSKNTAPLVFASSHTNFVKFRNLVIKNAAESISSIMTVRKGWVKLENTDILNNGMKSAIHVFRINTTKDPVVVDIISSQIKNTNAGTSLSPNKYAPIQLRAGVELNLSKNSNIFSAHSKAPTIIIDYGSDDNYGSSTITLDNTITSTHGNIEGVVIYSATPSDKWLDKININGVQLIHNDETQKGGKSTISDWNVFDANDWDLFVLNYDGYVYTNNQEINPDDYLSLLN